MVDSVCAMLLVDTLQQIGRIVLGRHLLLVDDVDASLVERYGIGRGEDAIGLRSEVRKISILFIISRNYYQSNYSDCYRD